jgi:sulfoxide reductase heme-binding subunit YedZ
MSASYTAILWNRQKKIYDRVLAGFVLLYLLTFVGGNLIINPEITQETLIIRAFHGILSIVQFHSLGNISPILSVFLSNTHYGSLTKFPFQTLGFFALIIFFLMAITSHDFWLHNLSPKTWKTLHMMVYVAYALIILHVLLGVIQFETSPILTALLAIGMTLVIVLHITASMKEYKSDNRYQSLTQNGFLMACTVEDIKEKRAKVICLGSERIAIFKYDNKISAISNVCKHQNGPLGEGRIIDGCITCPWHGYQYLPHNGSSPPPFKEKVVTYRVQVVDREVWIDPSPFPEGTELEPAVIKT